jgi:hypothetical protein
MLIVNAFSLNMFDPSICFPVFREIDVNEVKTYPLESAIGHADTARILSGILGVDISTNRISVTLNPGDSAIVAQYIGPRLPEGATQLPSGATIKFYYLEMVDVNSLKLTSSQR